MSHISGVRDKRRERSLAFFANKKCKYKSNKKGNEESPNVQTICEQTSSINFILTDFSLILANQIKEPFPSVLDFLTKIKQNFKNSNIILFTDSKSDIILAKKYFPSIDLLIELNRDSHLIIQEERPILYLRKQLFKQNNKLALIGPYILITKTMNSNNNKQYDIVKDIRRFYIFKENVLIDVNYQHLLNNIKKSVDNFFN